MPDPSLPVPSPESSNAHRAAPGTMFAEPATAAARDFPATAVAIAALAVLILAGLFFAMSRRSVVPAGAAAGQANAAYAPKVGMSDVAMSESTSFSGGKQTFLDGKITNSGSATVTGVSVQVAFASDGGGAPQLETVPVNLIRMRQPEIDTEPVSAEPLAPGATKDFRLIFDDVKPEWNQQVPELHVTAVTTR